MFKPILDKQGFKFININIEKDCKINHSNIIDLNSSLDKKFAFADTSAIMALSDKIITVDTSIVHLSGAMNCDTILLLNHDSEWRWFTNTEHSQWYPSIKIVRINKETKHLIIDKISSLLS